MHTYLVIIYNVINPGFFLQEFALCAQWVELYPVSEQLRLRLQTEHLLHLLEKEQKDEAFQVNSSTFGYTNTEMLSLTYIKQFLIY